MNTTEPNKSMEVFRITFISDYLPIFGRSSHLEGQVVARRGVEAASIAQKRLTSERLVTALRTALEQPSIQTRAAELGQQIRSENEVAQASKLLESIYTRI